MRISSPNFSGRTPPDKDMYRACLQAKGYQRVDGGQWEAFATEHRTSDRPEAPSR